MIRAYEKNTFLNFSEDGSSSEDGGRRRSLSDSETGSSGSSRHHGHKGNPIKLGSPQRSPSPRPSNYSSSDDYMRRELCLKGRRTLYNQLPSGLAPGPVPPYQQATNSGPDEDGGAGQGLLQCTRADCVPCMMFVEGDCKAGASCPNCHLLHTVPKKSRFGKSKREKLKRLVDEQSSADVQRLVAKESQVTQVYITKLIAAKTRNVDNGVAVNVSTCLSL